MDRSDLLASKSQMDQVWACLEHHDHATGLMRSTCELVRRFRIAKESLHERVGRIRTSGSSSASPATVLEPNGRGTHDLISSAESVFDD